MIIHTQVKWRWKDDKSVPDTPTAVLLHGILGSGKNWGQCCVVPCEIASSLAYT